MVLIGNKITRLNKNELFPNSQFWFLQSLYIIVGFFIVASAIFSAAWAATISDSDAVDITAVVPSNEPPPAVPGGGGVINKATVSLSGQTFPGAKLTMLIDGQIRSVLMADNSGQFRVLINNLNFGNYQVSLYAEDNGGVQSAPYTLNVQAFSTQPYAYENILLPPTLRSDNLMVAQGQNLIVYGYAAPGASVEARIAETQISLGYGVADSQGFYRLALTLNVDGGIYSIRTISSLGGFASPYSKPIQVVVYEQIPGADPQIPQVPPVQLAACVDFNQDSRVNLVDFSILIFWLNKQQPPASIDCNGDNEINITDFSLLMYYWTG